jgi:nitric oxide reductase NorE protein
VIAQREELAARPEVRLPGDINMWVFVLGDLFIFGFYFVVFLVYRFHEPKLFRQSQEHLNLLAGTLNTLVLLTSSRFVALAVQAARARDNPRASRLIKWAIGCAAVFTALKVFEWSSEISRGFTLPHNDFFMFYFMLTGVHLFHVLLGVLILGVVMYQLRDPALNRVSVVEAGATYWHMVDVVWVVLFALLYVLR